MGVTLFRGYGYGKRNQPDPAPDRVLWPLYPRLVVCTDEGKVIARESVVKRSALSRLKENVTETLDAFAACL